MEEGVGVDFDEFTLGFVESDVKCGSGVNWGVRMKGSVDHSQ